MATDLVRIPSAYLKEVNPAAAGSFRELREALVKPGPLDHETCEYIIINGFGLAGFEEPFKIHVLRMLQRGVAPEKLQHAMLVSLGANAPLFPVVRALRWIEEVLVEHKAAT